MKRQQRFASSAIALACASFLLPISEAQAATTGNFSVAANSEAGTSFTIPNGATSCTFTATGTWYDGGSWNGGPEGLGSCYTTAIRMCPGSLGALIANNNGTYVQIGSSKDLVVNSNQKLQFLFNDVPGSYAANTGSMIVSYSCTGTTDNPLTSTIIGARPALTTLNYKTNTLTPPTLDIPQAGSTPLTFSSTWKAADATAPNAVFYLTDAQQIANTVNPAAIFDPATFTVRIRRVQISGSSNGTDSNGTNGLVDQKYQVIVEGDKLGLVLIESSLMCNAPSVAQNGYCIVPTGSGVVPVYMPCAKEVLPWGGSCSATVPITTAGQSITLENQLNNGYTGTATFTCTNGSWTTNSIKCDAQSPTVKLADVINQYRVEKGLSKIPVSYSLTMVAEAHVNDLEKNNPAYGSCNLHSWSNQGNWTSCCYTADHAQSQCMWNKPKEITKGVYSGSGYEISAMGYGITPESALEMWKGSPGHHDVILNKDIWLNMNWKSMGAAVSGSYAVVWFGTENDSNGSK